MPSLVFVMLSTPSLNVFRMCLVSSNLVAALAVRLLVKFETQLLYSASLLSGFYKKSSLVPRAPYVSWSVDKKNLAK